MALGGGVFTAQNKVLPGVYVNFVSTAQVSSALSERGVVTMPLALDWGAEGTMFTVTAEQFAQNSLAIFGYESTAEELRTVRELFRHARTAHLFRLGTGAKQAKNDLATAKFGGKRGNDISISVQKREKPDSPAAFDVEVYLDGTRVFLQENVTNPAELQSNAFVEWNAAGSLSAAVSLPLSGGENGTVKDGDFSAYLSAAEGYAFHAMGCPSEKSAVQSLFVDFTRRMRENVGKKFQTVLFRCPADYEGVVSVKNGVAGNPDDPALVAWVTGVVGGIAVNQSATNQIYDGEYDVDATATQSELEEAVKEGYFLFHKVDDVVRVLKDRNTLISATVEKSEEFSSNQTVRVLDQIANDIALLFARKYLGKIPNDNGGRLSLWNDIVQHHRELETLRAIENFDSSAVTVERGEGKTAVVVTDRVTPVSAMEQLYMTVYVE